MKLDRSRHRFFCEGCRAPLPWRELPGGDWSLGIEQCFVIHPALFPPFFPIKLQVRIPGEEWKGPDAEWATVDYLTDPVKLGFLTQEQWGIIAGGNREPIGESACT